MKIHLLFFVLVISLLVSTLLIIIKTHKKKYFIREPATAGSFYPADASVLSKNIYDSLNRAKSITSGGKLRILFVPHAGISYSGNTAASGFKQIEGKNYSRIILLGSSHRHLFSHAAVFDQGSWKTPLGKVKIDENLATAILDKKYNITADISPHNEEHSLEVELIFLQKVLKNFRIVPILVSQSSDELINNLAQKISDNFDDQTLLVVSSDLSHYPTWETANLVDKQTIKAILTGKKELFERSIAELESKKYPNVETLACGAQSIRVGLKMAEILNLTDFKKIAYENSGDVSGDRSRVVGYGAIGVWSEKITSAPNQLGKQSQAEALDIARKTLDTYLNTDTVPAISPDNQDLLMPLGAFVTLRKMGELRGCIGEFESSIPLFQVVQNMTVAAATKDSRFLPVTKDELKQIKIEISVMTRKKKIENWKSVRLGKDGVVVQKGFQSGAFLPQVANETGWSLEKFLSELCSQKAGLPSHCYQDPNTSIFTFQAQVFNEK